MKNKYTAKDFVPSQHDKRGFNYKRFHYTLAIAGAIAMAAFYLLGWNITAPAVEAATPQCLAVSELPSTGK